MTRRGPHPRAVKLTHEEQDLLEHFARQTTAPAALVQRAKIILLADQGSSNKAIAQRLACGLRTVEKWRARWIEHAPARQHLGNDERADYLKRLLSDAPRSGAPVTFSAEEVTQIVALALQEPSSFGRPVSHWTPKELAHEAVKQDIVKEISPRSVGRFLKRSRSKTTPESVLA